MSKSLEELNKEEEIFDTMAGFPDVEELKNIFENLEDNNGEIENE